VGVKALLRRKDGKYLLVKRSAKKYAGADGVWDIVGGRIEPGISLEENLAREIKEETGLKLAGRPKLVAAQDILRVPGKHVVRLTYAAKIKGTMKLDPAEAEDAGWFTWREIKKKDGLDRYFKELVEKGEFRGRD